MICRLKQLRKALNLSQAEFGKRLGVSRDVISNIEYGRVQPREIFIDHLCAVFGTSKEWIMDGKGEMFSANPIASQELQEAMALFSRLSPILQDYALMQIRGLLRVQNEHFEITDQISGEPSSTAQTFSKA